MRVGTKLYGFCGGMFGRESYGDKIVEGVGADWVVAREDNGAVVFFDATGRDLDETLAEYMVKDEREW